MYWLTLIDYSGFSNGILNECVSFNPQFVINFMNVEVMLDPSGLFILGVPFGAGLICRLLERSSAIERA